MEIITMLDDFCSVFKECPFKFHLLMTLLLLNSAEQGKIGDMLKDEKFVE